MPATLEDAMTYARGLGSDFSVDALRERFGGSARDNTELARKVKVELAAEAARERYERLQAARIPDTVRPIIEGLLAALGDATLQLQDALLAEQERVARTITDAVAAADRRAEAALLAERERIAASLSQKQSEAAQREDELRAQLTQMSNELLASNTRAQDLERERDSLRAQLASDGQALADLRQRVERAEQELKTARETASHARDAADLARRDREGCSGELRATQASLRSAEAQICRLQEMLADRGATAARLEVSSPDSGSRRDAGGTASASCSQPARHPTLTGGQDQHVRHRQPDHRSPDRPAVR